jgi:hypothetical protein
MCAFFRKGSTRGVPVTRSTRTVLIVKENKTIRDRGGVAATAAASARPRGLPKGCVPKEGEGCHSCHR